MERGLDYSRTKGGIIRLPTIVIDVRGGMLCTPSRKGEKKKKIFLVPQEYAVLKEILAERGDKTNLYVKICKASGGAPLPKIVDVIVRSLRLKFDAVTLGASGHIVTKWGKGYDFSVEPQDRTGLAKRPRGPKRRLLRKLAWLRHEKLAQKRAVAAAD